MQKTALILAALLVAPAISSAQWTETAFDDFDGTNPITYDALVVTPADVATGNSVWDRNVQYDTLTGPAITQPAEGDGNVLRAHSNNIDGATQLQYQTFDPPGDTDAQYAVEALVLPYLADDNSNGGTTWGGIGIRVDANFENGYYTQLRSDDSTGFGNYINFYKRKDTTDTFICRVYFTVGDNGTADGEVTSPIIRDPEEAASNQWIPLRLEVVDNTGDGSTDVILYADGLATPVVTYNDTDPVTAAGKGMLLQEDPFDSETEPDNSSGMFFEYVKVDDYTTSAADWELYY